MFKYYFILFLSIFLIFSGFDSYSQQNPGIKGTGPAPVKRFAEDVHNTAPRKKKLRERRDNEEEEESKNPSRKMNPASPAVSSYGQGRQRQANQLTSGTNLSVHSNFLAGYIGDNGTSYYPPDCNGDISSASQILLTVNGRLKVYNVPGASGAALTTTTASSNSPLGSPVLNLDIDAFFTNAGLGINKITDPHVRFDRLSGRWFIIAQDKNHNSQNYLCIAVSNTSTLTGASSFSLFYLQSSTGSSDPTNDWMDYPTLGIDKFGLYIGANIFDKATHTVNKGSSLYLINKASLLAGTLSFTAWPYGTGAGKSGSNGIAGVGMLTPQGVQNDDPAATEGYFIATDWAAFGSLIIKRVTDPGGSPSLSADILLTVPTTSESIDQSASGTPGNIYTMDDRLFAAMIMKNKITGASSLWTAHNIEVNASGVGTVGGGRNGSRWYEITNLNTTPDLNQSGTVYDNNATTPRGYYMPSIATNGHGNTLLGSSTSASNRRVQVAYATRSSTDAAGTMQGPDTVTTITSNYNPGGGLQRWGDYSQTVVDPKDNMSLWTFQEYTTNNNQWGLRAVQVLAPPPAQSPVATAVPANFCGSAVAVTIVGSSTNNAGFFDPGADAGGPGYNRLTITCSGSVLVSNVSFVSATQVTCVLNTSGHTAGTYTLTITNPDGQSVTSDFTLGSCGAVPITLLHFSGRQSGSQNDLNWQTVGDLSVKEFEIERSSDGINFNRIGIMQSQNHAGINNYSFTDISPVKGLNYYRLRYAEKDGGIHYSEIVLIKNNAASDELLISVFPNPAHKFVQVDINADAPQVVGLELNDYTGRKISGQAMQLAKGINQQRILVEQLPSGVYFLQIRDAAYSLIKSIRIVKE